jgi:hypothetical protein
MAIIVVVVMMVITVLIVMFFMVYINTTFYPYLVATIMIPVPWPGQYTTGQGKHGKNQPQEIETSQHPSYMFHNPSSLYKNSFTHILKHSLLAISSFR